MNKFRILTLILLIIISIPSIAEKTTSNREYEIVGKVVNNGKELPFINIVIKGTQKGVSTDENGNFKISNIKKNQVTLIVQGVGYITKELKIDINKYINKPLQIELPEDMVMINQVVVTGDRNEKKRKNVPVVVNVISSKKFKLANTTNLADGLTFTPGLRVETDCQNCGFSQLRMNGMQGPYTQILINSRPVFSGLAGVYGLEQIPTEMIERIEVIRGGGSALYGGNAIAGIVNIITKDPISDNYGIRTSMDVIGIGTKADKTASNKVISFHSSVTSEKHNSGLFVFGHIQNQDSWDANNDEFSEIAMIKSKSAGLNYFYKPTSKDKITVDYHNIHEYRRGGSDFDFPNDKARISEMVNHDINGGSITYDNFISEKINFSAYTSGQFINRKSYYGANMDSTAYGKTNNITLVNGCQVNINADNFIFAPATILLGTDYKFEKLNDKKIGGYLNTSGSVTPNSIIADELTHTLGFFAQSEWNVGFMRILTGLRYDHFKIIDKINNSGNYTGNVFIPRINLLYDITDKMQARISYARGYRAPQIFDEDLHIEASGARRIIHVNSPDLVQENSNSYSGSIDYTKATDNWQIYSLLEGFYTVLENPFNSEYSSSQSGIITSTRKNSNDGAAVKGINYELKIANIKGFEIQSGFTYQISKYKSEQQWGENETNKSSYILRTPNNYGYLTLNYKPTHTINISGTVNYTGSMYVPHLAGGLTNINQLISNESLVTTKSFYDLGLKISKHIDIKNMGRVEFYTGIANIINSYQSDFDKGINRDASYIYGPRRPRTIYFGIKLNK